HVPVAVPAVTNGGLHKAAHVKGADGALYRQGFRDTAGGTPSHGPVPGTTDADRFGAGDRGRIVQNHHPAFRLLPQKFSEQGGFVPWRAAADVVADIKEGYGKRDRASGVLDGGGGVGKIERDGFALFPHQVGKPPRFAQREFRITVGHYNYGW